MNESQEMVRRRLAERLAVGTTLWPTGLLSAFFVHSVPPHPDPLPRGEGTASIALLRCQEHSLRLPRFWVEVSAKRVTVQRRTNAPETALGSPSPQGRGPGWG